MRYEYFRSRSVDRLKTILNDKIGKITRRGNKILFVFHIFRGLVSLAILVHDNSIGRSVWISLFIYCELCWALTEYCREEFEKFTTFLTSKKCRNWPVFGRNWSIFRVKKVVLVFVTIVTLRQYSVK